MNHSLDISEQVACREQLLTMEQIAKRLNISKRSVQRLRHDHKLPPPISLGSLLRWNVEVIETWISQGCPGASNTNPGES